MREIRETTQMAKDAVMKPVQEARATFEDAAKPDPEPPASEGS